MALWHVECRINKNRTPSNCFFGVTNVNVQCLFKFVTGYSFDDPFNLEHMNVKFIDGAGNTGFNHDNTIETFIQSKFTKTKCIEITPTNKGNLHLVNSGNIEFCGMKYFIGK